MNEYENQLIGIAKEKWIKQSNIEKPASKAPSVNGASPAPQSEPPSNTISFSTLDVFTAARFRGNQLAIIHSPPSLPFAAAINLPHDTKQAIAREFDYSETVFLHDALPGTMDRRLDIFTLKGELPFAGHPVIGAICHACQSVEPPLESVTLVCKAGPIEGRYDQVTKIAQASIPHDFRLHKQLVGARAVLKHTYLAKTSIITSELPVASIVKGMTFVLINVPTVKQHLELLRADQQVDCVAVKLDEGWDESFIGTYFYTDISGPESKTTKLRTRMLEPSVGEDAATGSAASTLGCFLALKDGKSRKTYHYSIEQGVEMGRASEIIVKVTLDDSGTSVSKVNLAGRAVLVTQGTMMLPTPERGNDGQD